MEKSSKLEIAALGALVVLGLFLHATDPVRSSEGLESSVDSFIGIAPIFIVTVFLAGLLVSWIRDDLVVRRMGSGGGNIPFAAAVGILTPGPIQSMYPLVCTLKKKGASSDSITAFLFGQTMIGPLRASLEFSFFSPAFLAFRLVLSFILSTAAGLTSSVFFKTFPEYGVCEND
ncbi:MAG: permease [Candidatus Altiarchaeota archaeon]